MSDTLIQENNAAYQAALPFVLQTTAGIPAPVVAVVLRRLQASMSPEMFAVVTNPAMGLNLVGMVELSKHLSSVGDLSGTVAAAASGVSRQLKAWGI